MQFNAFSVVVTTLAVMTLSLGACGSPGEDGSPTNPAASGASGDGTSPPAGFPTGDLGSSVGTSDAGTVGGGDASTNPGSDAGAGPVADAGSGPSTDAGTGPGPSPGPAPEQVDPDCVDGQYSETLATPGGDISGIISAYNSSDVKGFIQAVLETRYPVGWWLVDGGLNSGGFGGQDCVEAFLGDRSTGTAVIRQLSTIVHECGHFFDMASWTEAIYEITPTTRFACQGGSYQGLNSTFARSLITSDEFSESHPPCGGGWGQGCDSYADVYLDGDPNDAQFDSGDQGFDTVLEEVTQYVNSLATAYAFNDFYTGSASERDGILTFLWYLTRYLRMARLDYPSQYQFLSGDTCWRQAILTVWGRAWLYLKATESMSQLGIEDAKLEGLVLDPVLVEEIQRIRDAEGCP